MDKKQYVIVHNSYDVAYVEDVQSITVVTAYDADEALQLFKESSERNSRGYVPVKVACIPYTEGHAGALKPVNVTVHTTERYSIR